MAILAAANTEPGADASTWAFLGVFAVLTAGMLVGWSRAIARWQPPALRDDLLPPQRYYDRHGIHDELDLGRHWRSTDDPGAYWHVWWLPDTGQLIGVRTPMEPPPVSRFSSASFMGHSWGGAMNPRIGGMKTLGVSGRVDRHTTDHLRLRADGLDQLCGGTRSVRSDPVA